MVHCWLMIITIITIDNDDNDDNDDDDDDDNHNDHIVDDDNLEEGGGPLLVALIASLIAALS